MRGNLVQVLLLGFRDGIVETDVEGVLGLEAILLCSSREYLRVGKAKNIMNSIDVKVSGQ
jgi:hypothetical protein